MGKVPMSNVQVNMALLMLLLTLTGACNRTRCTKGCDIKATQHIVVWKESKAAAVAPSLAPSVDLKDPRLRGAVDVLAPGETAKLLETQYFHDRAAYKIRTKAGITGFIAPQNKFEVVTDEK